MLKHILKDLLFHRRFLLAFGLIWPVYMSFFGSRLSTPTVAAILGAFLYALVPIMVFSREDKFKAVAFSLSLPTTRREMLRSHYVLSWALMTVLYVAASLLMVVMPGGKLGWAKVFSLQTILLTLAAMTLVFAVLMPLFVRFGMVGMMVFLVVMQVLGVVFMLLRMAIGRSAISAVKALPRFIAAVLAALGPAGAAAVVVVLLLGINAISYGISARLFARKEF